MTQSQQQSYSYGFSENFWGDQINGIDVLFQILKNSQTSVKEFEMYLRECATAEDQYVKHLNKVIYQMNQKFLHDTSMAPLWQDLLRELCKQNALSHMQYMHRMIELTSELQTYSDELRKKRHKLRESESKTQQVVELFRQITQQLHKSRDLYHSLSYEYEKQLNQYETQQQLQQQQQTLSLTQTSTTATAQALSHFQKLEKKTQTACDEYRANLDKYNAVRFDFEQRMSETCALFQSIEESHLKQMRLFVIQYTNLVSQLNGTRNKNFSEYQHKLHHYTCEFLLQQLVRAKATGQERPQDAIFVEAPPLAAMAMSNYDVSTIGRQMQQRGRILSSPTPLKAIYSQHHLDDGANYNNDELLVATNNVNRAMSPVSPTSPPANNIYETIVSPRKRNSNSNSNANGDNNGNSNTSSSGSKFNFLDFWKSGNKNKSKKQQQQQQQKQSANVVASTTGVRNSNFNKHVADNNVESSFEKQLMQIDDLEKQLMRNRNRNWSISFDENNNNVSQQQPKIDDSSSITLNSNISTATTTVHKLSANSFGNLIKPSSIDENEDNSSNNNNNIHDEDEVDLTTTTAHDEQQKSIEETYEEINSNNNVQKQHQQNTDMSNYYEEGDDNEIQIQNRHTTQQYHHYYHRQEIANKNSGSTTDDSSSDDDDITPTTRVMLKINPKSASVTNGSSGGSAMDDVLLREISKTLQLRASPKSHSPNQQDRLKRRSYVLNSSNASKAGTLTSKHSTNSSDLAPTESLTSISSIGIAPVQQQLQHQTTPHHHHSSTSTTTTSSLYIYPPLFSTNDQQQLNNITTVNTGGNFDSSWSSSSADEHNQHCKHPQQQQQQHDSSTSFLSSASTNATASSTTPPPLPPLPATLQQKLREQHAATPPAIAQIKTHQIVIQTPPPPPLPPLTQQQPALAVSSTTHQQQSPTSPAITTMPVSQKPPMAPTSTSIGSGGLLRKFGSHNLPLLPDERVIQF